FFPTYGDQDATTPPDSPGVRTAYALPARFPATPPPGSGSRRLAPTTGRRGRAPLRPHVDRRVRRADPDIRLGRRFVQLVIRSGPRRDDQPCTGERRVEVSQGRLDPHLGRPLAHQGHDR